MKTVYIGLGAVIGSLLGFLPFKKEHATKVEYLFPLTLDSSVAMDVKYSQAEDGATGSWTHCGSCKQGVLTPDKDGAVHCTYCGK